MLSSFDMISLSFMFLILSLISFIDWIGGFECCSSLFSLLLFLLFSLFLLVFLYSSLMFFFINFEVLVMMLFFVVMIFCSSYYKISTSFYLYSFSLIGCLFLYIYINLFIMFNFNSIMFSLLLLMPFLIKMPSFPFFYWLPEVHCEVNTSTSLFLAGLLLKLGVYGILSFMFNSLFIMLYFMSSFMISFSLLGIFMVLGGIFSCFDMKKIIGFSSIMHLNYVLCVVFLVNHYSLLTGMVTSISHGFCSVGLFLYAGILISKSYTRYIDCLFFIDYIYLIMLVLLLLCNLSFPGSMNFMSELLCLICLLEIDCYLFMYFICFSFLSYFYFFIMFNRIIPIIPCFLMLGLFILSLCNLFYVMVSGFLVFIL